MSKKIFIACDNEHISDLISNYAAKEGFTVRAICDISEDTQHVVRECCMLHPDIIILGGCYLDAEQECRLSSLMSDIYTLKNDGSEHTLSLPLDIAQLSKVFEKYDKKKAGVFSKEQLAYEVFGPDAKGSDALVEESVSLLKSKLDGLSSKWSIRLIWGVGYKFEVNVQ